jgi:hypothetical protein
MAATSMAAPTRPCGSAHPLPPSPDEAIEIFALLGQGRGAIDKRTAMTAGIVFLIGLMFLATQLMGQGSTGEWPSITLASEFNIPADRVFSEWIILDKPIRFMLDDVQLWTVLVLAAALIYWVTDWTAELLSRLGKRAPPLPQQTSAPAESSDSL